MIRKLVVLLLALVVAVQLALLLAAWPEPDLRSTVCDFPEGCLEDIAARFTVARWLWLIGLLVGAAAVAALARRERRTATLTGIALLGYVASGMLTPLVQGADALSYGRYSNVTVLNGPYVFALVLLTTIHARHRTRVGQALRSVMTSHAAERMARARILL